MRRVTMWILATVCGLVLLFSYRTSTMGQSSSTGAETAERGSANDATSAGTSSGDSGTSSSTTGSTSGTTFDGDAVRTRYGNVQVRVTIENGKLVDVKAIQYPNSDHHDVQINNYALPLLRKAAIAAQSANIDSVSGATVTSDGYRTSLQSALDAANFKG